MNSSPSFYDSFDNADIARIAAVARRVTLPANWSPIWERTPADKAYIILEGEVSVRRGGAEITRLGAGDIVGETAILTNSLRTASVVTLTRVVLLHLTDDAVRRLVQEVPRFAEVIGAVVEHRSPAA